MGRLGREDRIELRYKLVISYASDDELAYKTEFN